MLNFSLTSARIFFRSQRQLIQTEDVKAAGAGVSDATGKWMSSSVAYPKLNSMFSLLGETSNDNGKKISQEK